jgi:hypothetical protein
MVVKICFMDPIYQLKHQNLHLWTVGPFCPYKTWPGCLSFTLPDNLRAFFPVPFPKATSNIRAVLVSPDQVALFFLTRCRKRKFLQKFTQCDLVASKSNKIAHARVCVGGWVGGEHHCAVCTHVPASSSCPQESVLARWTVRCSSHDLCLAVL